MKKAPPVRGGFTLGKREKIQVSVSVDELALIKRAAKAADIQWSVWARERLVVQAFGELLALETLPPKQET